MFSSCPDTSDYWIRSSGQCQTHIYTHFQLSEATALKAHMNTLQDLLLAVLVQSDDIKLAPNHAEMPSLLARMKPSALAKHVQKQKVGTRHQ